MEPFVRIRKTSDHCLEVLTDTSAKALAIAQALRPHRQHGTTGPDRTADGFRLIIEYEFMIDAKEMWRVAREMDAVETPHYSGVRDVYLPREKQHAPYDPSTPNRSLQPPLPGRHTLGGLINSMLVRGAGDEEIFAATKREFPNAKFHQSRKRAMRFYRARARRNHPDAPIRRLGETPKREDP
jgi:hypothetical protein